MGMVEVDHLCVMCGKMHRSGCSLSTDNKQLREKLAETTLTLDLVQSRVTEATDAWKEVTGCTNREPDLGDLLHWSLRRAEAAEARADSWSDEVRDLGDRLGLGFTEYETNTTQYVKMIESRFAKLHTVVEALRPLRGEIREAADVDTQWEAVNTALDALSPELEGK